MSTIVEKSKMVSGLLRIESMDGNFIDTISQELDALEKNPVNGWNIVFPTLYNALNKITSDLCIKLKCDVPNLFIDFQGPQRFQASAYLMTDGTAQLHIGVDFIREFLLNRSTDCYTMRSAFVWSIAHELGHISDSNFKTFANSYYIRLFVDRVAWACFLLGLISFIPGVSIAWGNFNSNILLILSVIFIILKKGIIIFLHRKFEYSADEKTVGAIDDFSVDIVKIALTKMTANIRTHITKTYENSTSTVARVFDWCNKKFTLARSFLLHPPIDSRIKRLEAVYKKHIIRSGAR